MTLIKQTLYANNTYSLNVLRTGMNILVLPTSHVLILEPHTGPEFKKAQGTQEDCSKKLSTWHMIQNFSLV